MASASPVTNVRTTKSGIDLVSFSDVILYKDVPVVAEVSSVNEALARLGNDHNKLLKIITAGLQEAAVDEARKSQESWMLMDEDRKPTDSVFEGMLADPSDVNPAILMFAKLMFGFEEIDSKDSKSAELKRASKDKARDYIKSQPDMLASLQKKAQAASK